jgi:hypothetical protein
VTSRPELAVAGLKSGCPYVTPVAGKLMDWLAWVTTPVPDRVTVCGLPGPLSAICSVAVLAPPDPGAKATPMVQLAPWFREAPEHLSLLTAKSEGSAPARVTEDTEIAEPRTFVKLML